MKFRDLKIGARFVDRQDCKSRIFMRIQTIWSDDGRKMYNARQGNALYYFVPLHKVKLAYE